MLLSRWISGLSFLALSVGSSLAQMGNISITNAPPSGVIGASYGFQFAVSGGSGPYRFTISTDISGGGFPPGLTASSSGQITGTPTKLGTYTFLVFVSDQFQDFGRGTFSITINPCSPAFITSSPLPPTDVGGNYSVTFKASGCNNSYTFAGPGSFATGPNGIPPGLTLDPTGLLSGSATTAGAYNFSVTVTDSGGGTTTSQFSLTVNNPPTITTTSPLPSGTVGAPYGPLTFAVSGGAVPYSFSVTGLPSGLTLSSTGVLAGTPKAAGSFQFGVSVSDSIGVTSPPKPFQITFITATSQLQVSPTILTFTANANGDIPQPQYVDVVPTTAATGPYTFKTVLDGGQANTPAPSWLSLSYISGVAPERLVVHASQGTMPAGSYPGRIRITDSNSIEYDVAITLVVVSTPSSLSVVPGPMRFSALQQNPASITQGIAVVNSGGGGAVGFNATVTGGSSWITGITPSSGQTTPNSTVILQLTVNSQGLGVGSYRDSIHFSSVAGSADIPVTLMVSGAGSILATNVTGVRLQAVQNGGYSNSKTIKILNIGDPASTVNWSASLVNPASWLSMTPSSGTATASLPGSLTLSLNGNATQMQPGPYYALIKITDSKSLNSPVYVVVVLDLAPAGTAPLPDLSPAGLVYTVTAGSAQSAGQNVTVNTSSASSVPFNVAAVTSDGGNWIVGFPASGSVSGAQPQSFGVAVNPTGKSAGVYSGELTVSIGNSLRTVNITMIVLASASGSSGGSIAAEALHPEAAACSASHVVPTETGLVNNFVLPAGWPATLVVQLNDDCGNLVPGGAVVASFSNGDPPLTLNGNGQGGTYSSTWQPGSVTSQMTVTLNASAGNLQPAQVQLIGGVAANQFTPPMLTASGTLNNLNPIVGAALAPGTIVQVYGTGLGPPPPGVSPGVLPLTTNFDNTYVLIGPYQAPLFYLSSNQMDILVPTELVATQQYPIIVSVNNQLTLPDLINIVPAAPGVASASGAMIAQHQDFSLVTSANPAKPGEYLIMYLAGLGPTNPSVASGTPSPSNPPATVTLPVTVTVNSENSTVAFAGLTPGAVGLYQINFQVPKDAASGNASVVVMQNNQIANSTTIPISQ